jgi:hypothetical protein
LKFRGNRIVGIKYDLLNAGPPPKERAKSVKEPKKASTFLEEQSKPRGRPPHEKVVYFTKPELQQEPDEENDALEDIKKEVRHAMALLEQGKQVAAFNLLKRIVE